MVEGKTIPPQGKLAVNDGENGRLPMNGVDDSSRELFVFHQVSIRVGHRTGRSEPRANKRRPKILALLTEPRAVAEAGLIAAP